VTPAGKTRITKVTTVVKTDEVKRGWMPPRRGGYTFEVPECLLGKEVRPPKGRAGISRAEDSPTSKSA
jgi:hypothetical protein